MLKRLQVILLTCLTSSSIYAMQVNVTPSTAYASNQYQTNIVSDIATGTFPNVQHITRKGNGLIFQYFTRFFDHFNQSIADIDPSHDVVSTLSLGYVKDGADVAPASCQNIKLKEVTNIVLDVNGCQVS